MNKIKEAFDRIEASSELKENTKLYILNHEKKYKRSLVLTFSMCIFLLIIGYWYYFIPITTISMDINPSLELEINRCNQVIAYQGYNEEGNQLIETMDLKYLNYKEAIQEIMNEPLIIDLMKNEEIMNITVVSDALESSEVYETIQNTTKENENVVCCFEKEENVSKAHKLGMSYGKYKAYLELKKIDPDISIDEAKDMKMCEIKERTHKANHGKEINHQKRKRNQKNP